MASFFIFCEAIEFFLALFQQKLIFFDFFLKRSKKEASLERVRAGSLLLFIKKKSDFSFSLSSDSSSFQSRNKFHWCRCYYGFLSATGKCERRKREMPLANSRKNCRWAEFRGRVIWPRVSIVNFHVLIATRRNKRQHCWPRPFRTNASK